MRHWIQKAGHEFLPLVLTLVGIFAALLFYLNNVFGDPPPSLVIVALIALAISTEWLTFTFAQDMQDAITQRQGQPFAIFKALVATGVSIYIFASATDGLWAPKGPLTNSLAWSWVLAVGVFSSQFLLKLTPERRPQQSLVNIALAVGEWAKDKPQQEQARIIGQMYNALAGQQVLALPSPQPSVPVQASAAPPPDAEEVYEPVNEYSGQYRTVTPDDLAEANKRNGHSKRGRLHPGDKKE